MLKNTTNTSGRRPLTTLQTALENDIMVKPKSVPVKKSVNSSKKKPSGTLVVFACLDLDSLKFPHYVTSSTCRQNIETNV